MKIVKTVTEDKLHLTGFLNEPKNSKENIIVHIHGMAGDPYTNAWYPHFHKLFPQNNIAFLVGNHRGTDSITMFKKDPDEYPNIGNALEKFEDCIYDIGAWVNCAKNLGYRNIFLQAHSLGPSKAVYYLNSREHTSIKGLVLISPVDMLGLTMIDSKYNKMLEEAQKLVKEKKENQLLSSLIDGEYYMSAKTFLNFFQKDSNCNIFCYTDRDHSWRPVNNIKIPTLIIGGTKDLGIEPIAKTPRAFEILKSELRNSPRVETKIYEGAKHSFEGFEEEIVKDITKFVLK